MVKIRPAAAGPAARAVDLPPGVPLDKASPDELRTAAGRLARELPGGNHDVDARGLAGVRLAAFAEGLALGCYRFTRARTPAPAPDSIALCGVAADGDGNGALERGLRVAAAANWARDLANTRGGEKSPGWLAERAAAALTPLGVQVISRDVDWLREQGFGGMLAVGGGSATPPTLIQATWRRRGAPADRHVVLVGKGITFDTGGLNRKTGTNMNLMFTDMSGGAAVLGAVHALAAAQVPIRVTALVPAAENSVSGTAYRPSDVITHFGGRTSEVANTDAEGRLVLADAIAYAAAKLRPTAIVDVATLTGAAKIALGVRTGGLFATSDAIADGLFAAGKAVGEPLWRLPMPVEYESALQSPIADATNSAGSPGAITAAMFLRPFAGSVPWAHLDIAGPARAAEDDGIFAQGATGFGARLLYRWLAEESSAS